ncbi:hypothetical protein BX600DRAFT_506632 [Xylariales sp. PMI_506]|nr:hypothetical protein BX600DRAFT_506632 [Xylariales sp. PMI_506]
MAPDSKVNSDHTITTTTTQHYTMKTTTRPSMSPSHSHSHHPRHSQSSSQSFRVNNRSTTPMASPRLAHSVGQSYPPSSKLSPVHAADVRTPSPNYFGLNIEPSMDRDSGLLPRDNWSPPTSSVKSFAAAIPKQLPLDANPEFEAFKRQADANRGKSFNLGAAYFAMQPPAPTTRPRPLRRPTNQSEASEMSLPKAPGARSRMDVDSDSLHDSAYVSSDSKRNSEVSLTASSFFDMPKHESPAQTDSPFHPLRRSNLSKVEDAQPRLSLPQQDLDQLTPGRSQPRSETLPATLDGSPGLIMPTQLGAILTHEPVSEFMVLDVRVSTLYAHSRIKGALNLCIPTTLLKRATFDLQKLQKTLQNDEDQEKFSQWRTIKYLIIYDSASAEKRDAQSAMNMFKKFSNEGFAGSSYLLRGGFDTFSGLFPSLIDHQSPVGRGNSTTSSTGGRPTFAPVIGGVALPSGANNPNPFFSNIRQNMDLADGVGQLDISVPPNLDVRSLPEWLKTASNVSDHGKVVSEKFLHIERCEQSRMRDAYSAFGATTMRQPSPGQVALSGIEKGSKNRYKDILPFEHARVRLPDKPEGSCDYINASHIHSTRTNKRYIASQGPLPSTFDDFWSVVWDQDVRVIVMLTAESEGGTLKCHSYWTGREFGPIKLKPLSEKKVSLDIDKHRASSTATTSSSTSSGSEHGRRRANTTTMLQSSTPMPQPQQSQPDTHIVVIRKFAMSHTDHPFAPIREVTHIHYPSWPDFGAPAQPAHLLALVELANVMQRAALPVDARAIAASVVSDNVPQMNWYEEPEHKSQARPMLVHCSAGCGRTGTFCTVDSVIDMLKRQKLNNSAASVRPVDDEDVEMHEPVSPSSTVDNPFSHRLDSSQGGQNNPFRPSLVRNSSVASVDVGWMGNDSVDLIQETVENFRGQRLSMVQSLRQYVLCYETVLEWVWRTQEKNSSALPGGGRARSGSLVTPPTR